MSKITVAGVRTNVKELLDYSNNEKKRNFLGMRPLFRPSTSRTATDHIVQRLSNSRSA